MSTDAIYTVSVYSAISHHLKLADRCAARLRTSKTPDSSFCHELRELEKMHRGAAEYCGAYKKIAARD